MPQPPFPQPDREAIAVFIDALFRYADDSAFINLRAFHDGKDGVPPLFVEAVSVGAPDLVDRVCERMHEAAAGFDIFDAWSKKSGKYDERNTKLRWNHFYQSPPSRIGAGTIFYLADQADPDWRRKIKTPEAEEWLKKEVEKSNKALAEQERVQAEKQRIDDLARKSPMDYDREREAAAAELGVRRDTLDREVADRREEIEVEDQPLLHPWWEVEPWEQPVETAALLFDLQEQVLKYIAMTKEQALVIALSGS
jgi:hypothetical protein